MKKRLTFIAALAAALLFAGACFALDAVSVMTGGAITEQAAAPASADLPNIPDPFADTIVQPYEVTLDADACDARAAVLGRQLEDWGRLKIDEAARRFGVSETAVNRRIMVLTSLRNTYPAIINALNRKSHIESELSKRKADITAPELTLTEKPPYLLKYYDAYIDQLDDLSEQIEDAQYDLDHAASAAEQTRKQLNDAEAGWRLARDNYAREITPQTTWYLNDASFSLELARAQNAVSGLRRENMHMILTDRKLARDRHARIQTYIRDHLDLSEKSFELQKAELAARVRELEASRTQLYQQYRKVREDLEAAEEEYAAARDEARAAALVKRDMYDDERERLRLALYQLHDLVAINTARTGAWTVRYDLARGAVSPSLISDAVKQLGAEAQTFDEQITVLQKDMLAMQSRLSAVQKQIDGGAAAPGVLDMLNRDRASVQAAIDGSLAFSSQLFSARGQIRALIAELQEKYQTVPLWEKARMWWQKKGSGILNTELWQSGGYAVRLREFLFALALVVLGSWGARRAFIMLLWLLGKRFNIDETSQRSLVRLFSYFAGTAIFLAALHIVGIPLTAFAFLGGAIAIGIGFGTQNLFKNFISGILLTLKRPFRIGNIIEVGSVAGTVFDIGIGATIVRAFDGKEIVIPNSELLDQQVVNWGLNDPLLRKTIEVGVEYGSSPKLVRETLMSVVAAHPDVLKHPEPRVLLTNYGDSSLDFTVYFWLNQRRSSGVLVSAQLREEIIYALDKAGLSMAYPHMDINLTPYPKKTAALADPPDEMK